MGLGESGTTSCHQFTQGRRSDGSGDGGQDQRTGSRVRPRALRPRSSPRPLPLAVGPPGPPPSARPGPDGRARVRGRWRGGLGMWGSWGRVAGGGTMVGRPGREGRPRCGGAGGGLLARGRPFEGEVLLGGRGVALGGVESGWAARGPRRCRCGCSSQRLSLREQEPSPGRKVARPRRQGGECQASFARLLGRTEDLWNRE